MQPRAADQPRLVGDEDAVDVVLAAVELAAEQAQQLDLLGERLRLLTCPGHPRPEVLEARVDRFLQQGGVDGLIAADHQPLRLDPVRRRQTRLDRIRVAASTVVLDVRPGRLVRDAKEVVAWPRTTTNTPRTAAAGVAPVGWS